MITSTARKHVIRALRDALRVNMRHAGEIVATIRNENALRLLGSTDMRTVKALVINSAERLPTVNLYVDGGQGYEFTGVALGLTIEDLDRWNALSLEDAYAIAADVHDNRGPLMRAADDRMAAEAAAEAFNDNDLLPEEEMDRVFGPIPEPRDWKWVDGEILSAERHDDHVRVGVRLADAEYTDMTMVPLFGTPADLVEYALSVSNVPARLCVARLSSFDHDLPAGADRSLPVLDMVVPQSEVPALVRSLRRAA